MNLKRRIVKKPWIGWVLFFSTVIIVILLAVFASSIVERRAEAAFAFVPKIRYEKWEPRNEVWGENFPSEFQSYMQTADTTFRSKYNGNAMIDMLEVDPRLVVLWAGYGFSKDYNQGRGHSYAIEDVRNTLRTGAPNRRPMVQCPIPAGPVKARCATIDERNGVAQNFTPENGQKRCRSC